ncbi:MAG: Gfo/Idh/MocA family oxidoreductase [Pirellulales bacterium]|nr:Gfo/Idh/MocA family oxidoreductase [Pirellulales bacterium]
MLRVGIAGIGFMGMIHYLAYQRVRGVRVGAISTRDPKKLAGDWRSIKGNFGPPGAQMDLSNLARYERFADLIADPQIDLVDICLPPDQHAEATIAALQAGKHVFCEKPIALSTADAERMVRAAEKGGKQLTIGHVLPFFPEYKFARQAIASGKYGKLLGGNFKRVISDPLWIPDFYDPRRVGGPVVDLHIHDAHFIRLVCGMPRVVSSRGRRRGEVVEYLETHFEFDDPALVVTATSGVIRQQGRAFTHGFEIHLERATLLYDFSVLADKPTLSMPLTVLKQDGRVEQPKLGAGDPLEAFVAEIAEVAGSIKRGTPSALLSGDLARDALVLCQKESQSALTGKVVRIGGAAKK